MKKKTKLFITRIILVFLSLLMLIGQVAMASAATLPFNVSAKNNGNGTLTVTVSGNCVGAFNVKAGDKSGQLVIKNLGGSDSATYTTGAGNVKVTVTAISVSDANYNLFEGNKVEKTVTVTVPSNPKINITNQTLKINHYVTLKITGNNGGVTWSSSNNQIATVNSSGKVTAIASGTATITAKVDGKTLTCKITVPKNETTTNTTTTTSKPKISHTSLNLTKNHYQTLTVSGNKGGITWSSSDSKIATVSNGRVTGISAGTATITAKVDNVNLTCKVTITDKNSTKVTDVSSSKNTDNTLKSLQITSPDTKDLVITPEFKPDVTTYSLNADSTIKTINIQATPNNSKAKIEGDGEHEVVLGENNFIITVTAENGKKQTYTISVFVTEQSKVFLKYNNDSLPLINDLSAVETPKGFEQSTTIIEGIECITLIHAQNDLMLVYLQNPDNTNQFYIYKNGIVEQPFKSLSILGKTYIVLNSPNLELKNMVQDTIKIDDIEVNCLRNENENGLVYLYLISEEGYEGLYRYDIMEGTIQRDFENKDKEGIFISKENIPYLFGGVGVLFMSIIVLEFIHFRTRKQLRTRNEELLYRLEHFGEEMEELEKIFEDKNEEE